MVRVKIHSICPNAHFQIFIRPDPDSSGASSLGFIPQKQKTAYGRWGSAEFSAFFEGSCDSGSVVINLINLGRSASLRAFDITRFLAQTDTLENAAKVNFA